MAKVPFRSLKVRGARFSRHCQWALWLCEAELRGLGLPSRSLVTRESREIERAFFPQEISRKGAELAKNLKVHTWRALRLCERLHFR